MSYDSWKTTEPDPNQYDDPASRHDDEPEPDDEEFEDNGLADVEDDEETEEEA